METCVKNLFNFLNLAEKISVPDFASNYIFDEEDFSRYFDEIIEAFNMKNSLFLGTFTFQNRQNKLVLIDGLKRLISLNLLLAALCNFYKNTSQKNSIASEKISKKYLFSNANLKIKYSPLFEKIMEEKPISEREKASSLYLAYNFFQKRISEKRISATNLFATLCDINFIPVLIEDETFDIIDLYNSINQKSDVQIKLINKYLLSKNDDKTGLWLNVISFYSEEFLTSFVKDFLTIQNNGKIPTDYNLYRDFKIYFETISKFQSFETIIQNLDKFARYYEQILTADFEDYEIKAEFELINSNSATDTYPYLMEVLNDLAEENINEEIFMDILKLVNRFIEDRKNTDPSSLTINFASLSKNLNRMLFLKEQTPKILN